MKNSKMIMIGVLLLAIFITATGYALFATELDLNGTAQVIGEWDVRITDVKALSASPDSDPGVPSFTNNSASFDAKLNQPGDTITYEITITNSGTIDAKLENVLFITDEKNGSDAIQYSSSPLKETLNKGESTTFTVTITYDANVQEVPEIKTKTITGIINYVQKT